MLYLNIKILKVVLVIQLLILVLNKVDVLDAILDRFMKIGISGATIIDTTGMGRTLAYNDNIPIFGGLYKFFEDCHPSNKTIFSVIRTEEMLQKAIKAIEDETGDLNDPGVGILFTLPIGYVKGLNGGNNK